METFFDLDPSIFSMELAQMTVAEEFFTFEHSVESVCYVACEVAKENVLLTHGLEARIVDFESATLMKRDRSRGDCGTQQFKAPEIMKTSSYTENVDSYSYGLLIHLLLANEILVPGGQLVNILGDRFLRKEYIGLQGFEKNIEPQEFMKISSTIEL
ncbi:hypothetical protein BGX23_008189 [Mortierella sp. AD031]|nr:hypothetical protein BGX23_008189 [Mortierella sp. AD031]KAG0198522.1 hypothetical protein BGX33_012275 [Mortierella sp. NVP41]